MTGRSFQFWGSSSITGNRNNIVFLLLLCSCVYKPSHFGQTTALFQSSTTHNVSLFFDTIYKKIPIAISTPFTSTLEISDNLRPDEKSALQKKKEIWEKYPLPQHWQPPALSNPLGNLKSIVFKCLCLCAYGQTNLECLWASIKLGEEGDENIWTERKHRSSKQFNNILMLVRPYA